MKIFVLLLEALNAPFSVFIAEEVEVYRLGSFFAIGVAGLNVTPLSDLD